MRTYYYPENLKQRATFWLWQLRDVLILASGILLSVFIFTQAGTLVPLAVVALYAFLSMRLEEANIMDYIIYAARYFFASQQIFYWRLGE